MKKILATLSLLLFALPVVGQRNDLGLFGVGNFNGGSFFYGNDLVAFSYRSSAGGGVEYRRWILPSMAVGAWFETNPSEARQFTDSYNPYLFNFKLERYEVAVPATVRFWQKKKLNPFLQFGFGFVVTHAAPAIAGWSGDANLIAGGGFDYEISSHWDGRTAVMVWDGRQGCFGDPRCKADFGQAQTLRAGAAYRW